MQSSDRVAGRVQGAVQEGGVVDDLSFGVTTAVHSPRVGATETG